MKTRAILFLLLLTATLGVIGWLYYGVAADKHRPQPSPHETVVEDLADCCRRKHVKSVQYDHFARLADGEQEASMGNLFRALAYSERIQEQQAALAILRLGGRYVPPKRVVVFRGPTAGNLERSILYERRSEDTLYYHQIHRHLHSGNRLAARALIWATTIDRRHRNLLETTRIGVTSERVRHYTVCPHCGNTYLLEEQDPYCPHCLTDSRFFVQF